MNVSAFELEKAVQATKGATLERRRPIVVLQMKNERRTLAQELAEACSHRRFEFKCSPGDIRKIEEEGLKRSLKLELKNLESHASSYHRRNAAQDTDHTLAVKGIIRHLKDRAIDISDYLHVAKDEMYGFGSPSGRTAVKTVNVYLADTAEVTRHPDLAFGTLHVLQVIIHFYDDDVSFDAPFRFMRKFGINVTNPRHLDQLDYSLPLLTNQPNSDFHADTIIAAYDLNFDKLSTGLKEIFSRRVFA